MDVTGGAEGNPHQRVGSQPIGSPGRQQRHAPAIVSPGKQEQDTQGSNNRGRVAAPTAPNNPNRMPPPPNLPGMPQHRRSLDHQHPMSVRAASNSNQHHRSRQPEQQPRGRNPVGSPPPNQRRPADHPQPHQQRRGPQQQQQQQTHHHQQQQRRLGAPEQQQQRRQHPSSSQQQAPDEIDEAAKAALALAAVAQAASASKKSPAEAAEIAKAQAHSIAKKQQQQQLQNSQQRRSIPAPRPEPRKLQPVNLDAVKELLRSLATDSEEKRNSQKESVKNMLLTKLSDGENDPFLLLLLLIEYIRGYDSREDENEGTEGVGSVNASSSEPNDEKGEDVRVAYACDRLLLILRKVELAYASLQNQLPKRGDVGDADFDDLPETACSVDMDIPDVVPDLLPPCTSEPGDPTLEFFRACMGEQGLSDLDHGKTDEEDSHGGNLSIDDLTSDMTGSTLDSGLDDDSKKDDHKNHSSMFSNMFSIKRNTFNKKSFGAVFGKKRRGGSVGPKLSDSDFLDSHIAECDQNGEYTVQIEREMLGLTVENVLERTVVRTVLAGGPAKKAGAKVGSLIVKVGNIETKNLTHFETIDELRQSQRPLQLVLRQISDEALRSAREEMGRLIRGAGFGKIIDGEPILATPAAPAEANKDGRTVSAGPEGSAPQIQQQQRPLVGGNRNIDIYSGILRKRWLEAAILAPRSKKHEPVLRAGEKLVWILTLFVVGLEREASRLMSLAAGADDSESKRRDSHSQYHHTAKDYSDAAKSVSKVLFDFVRKRFDPNNRQQNMSGRNGSTDIGGRQGPRGGPMGRGGRGPGRGRAGPPLVPGMPGAASPPSDGFESNEKLLVQIGDVLQRTRTFLADPTSPPAALLRGELIACLCDILDADTEMELSEEESASQTAGGKAGPITDLGSAGSLLKLIVLNCPIMRSPECAQVSSQDKYLDPDELKRRFGENADMSSCDFHRLHAGNRFLAVVHRLAASRSTSARITACSLGPVLWGHLDFPHQLQLRGVITRALHDVEVIVRKSTATVLHEIAELVFDPRCVPWLVLMCERAMTDPEPLLRSAAMTLTWHLAEHLPNAFLGDASKGSRYLRRLPSRDDPIFADVYLLQCKLLPVATRLAEDRAPQVRLAVAAQCDRLCDALGDHWSSVIIDVLVALLTDSDDRVRSEAVLCVPRLADIVLLSSPPGVIPAGESSVLDALLPAATKLQKDSSASVRIALATAAGDLLTLLVGLQRTAVPVVPENPSGPVSIRHQKRHVDERLIPLVQKLLHDPDPEVTSSALRAVTNASRGAAREIRARYNGEDDDAMSASSHQSQLSMEKQDPVFVPVLSEEQVLRLLPTLSELANSRQWRVRQSAVEIVPALLGCTTKFETRAEIARLCIRLSHDKVDAVRKTAAECLCLGGGNLGSHGGDVSGEWITALVIPQIQACAKNLDYKQRLLCLRMVEVILLNDVCPNKWKDETANAKGRNSPLRELLKITLSLANDRIANVRLNVGRVLGSVMHVFDEEECRVVKYALMQQMKAEQATVQRQDRDVLFFGKRSLNKVRLRLDGDNNQGKSNPEDTRRIV